jgi:pimeloyl-ACP methyl ester carboxylesterase
MAIVRNGDYDLWYDVVGPADARPLLLVGGFTAQAISWQDGFADAWIERGFRVITMDNRDVGLSTKSPESDTTLYTLSDMAADCIAVLDAVGVDRAHVFGNSMGGMIVQTIAIEHPTRVATLTSVMSTTGDPSVGRPSPEALAALTRPAPDERAEFIEHYVEGSKVYCGPRFDEAWTRLRAGREYDRCRHPAGAVHQMRAIIAGGDRTERLGGLGTPTLVVHGRADTLIAFDGGEATAAAIPGARLLALDEMGHNLPISYWPEILDAVCAL